MILILIAILFTTLFSIIRETPYPQFFETHTQVKALAMHIRIFGNLPKKLKHELGLSKTFFTHAIKYQPTEEYTQETLQSIDEWQPFLANQPKFNKIENKIALILNDTIIYQNILLYSLNGHLARVKKYTEADSKLPYGIMCLYGRKALLSKRII